MDKNKFKINERHIAFYDRTLSVLEFLLNEFEHDIKSAELDVLELPKNTIASLDFLISAVGKVQKGQRLALGLDSEMVLNDEPEINVVDGLSKSKI